MSKDVTVKIRALTEGFEDAQQEVESLAEAYDGFPAQITIKNCRNCTFNIYPSQTKIIDTGRTVRDEDKNYRNRSGCRRIKDV